MEKLIEEVASRIVATCMTQGGVHSCTLYYLDPASDTLTQLAGDGSTSRGDDIPAVLENLSAIKKGEVVTENTSGGSEIAVPMVAGSGLIGVIYSKEDQPDSFTDERVQILKSISSTSASLLSAAIDFKSRAELHELEKTREIERVKSEFLDQVSHEMRTSLTLIIGPLDELIQSSKDPGHTAQLNAILEHAKKLQSITNGMFQFHSLHKREEDAELPASIMAMDAHSTYVDLDVQSKKPVVVLVEDSDQLRRFLNQILVDEFTLIETTNGLEGLEAAIEHVPDLIISDIMMPKMDGLELCEKVKSMEITSHIPVLLLTALADLESRLEGLETGADYYLGKPFEPRELLTASHSLVAQRKKLRDHFAKKLLVKTQEWEGVSADERFLQRLMALIEEHIADPDFTIEDLQKDMGISRMQLHRKLKALTDKSATEFVRTVRLKRAAEMLQKGQDNVSQVAYQVGFNSLSYFTKCFKEQFGVLPSAFSQ